jgi:cytochrome P450
MFQLIFYFLIFVALLLLLIYWYGHAQRLKVYHTKTGEILPGFSILFIPWFLLTQTGSFLQYNLKHHKKSGPMTTGFFIYQMVVRIRDPLLAKQVLNDTDTYHHQLSRIVKHADDFLGSEHLVSVNNQQWKKQRKILDPAFKSLQNYSSIFAEKTAIVLDKLIEKDGPIIDNVHKYTQAMALDILGLSIFGYDFKSLTTEEDSNLKSYNHLISVFLNITKTLTAMVTHNLNFLESTQETIKQLAVWSKLREDLIEKSKKRIKDKTIDSSQYTMLDMMVESNLENEEDEKLSHKEIIDNIGIFFLAGHETTANALAFGIHCLAKYPVIQSKLRKEIHEKIQNVTAESIEKLPYLTCFIKEVLRVFPPIASIPAKITSKDTVLGDYFIPKGTLVGISVLDIHMNEEFYYSPEEFIPERWEKDAPKKIPHHAWVPFSGGSRVCIGNNFSMMEQKIFFTELLMKYEVSLVDKTKEIEVSNISALIQSPQDLKIKFERLK